MPQILLVRHTDAGDRVAWTGPDLERPLTEAGRRAAADLVGPVLAVLRSDLPRPGGPGSGGPGSTRAAPVIRSSPAVRCLATIAPLAEALGAGVETDPALTEGSTVRPLVDRLMTLTTSEVWSTHGDVIPALLRHLAAEGLPLGPDPRCRKGSTWVLDVDDGRPSRATYLPPP